MTLRRAALGLGVLALLAGLVLVGLGLAAELRQGPAGFQHGLLHDVGCVEFALEAIKDPQAKVFVHCAAGVHRAPMMTLAILRSMSLRVSRVFCVTMRP